MRYEFFHSIRAQKLTVGASVKGKGMIDVVFLNGLFVTDDDTIAEALQKHPNFNSPNALTRFTLISVKGSQTPPKEEPDTPLVLTTPVVPVDKKPESSIVDEDLPVDAPTLEKEPTDEIRYEDMDRDDLIQLAKTRGLYVKAAAHKANIVQALRAHDAKK